MIISIWRYSHLTLAVSSFLFILIASVTGIILAFEPISEQLKPYAFNLDTHHLAEVITVLQEEYAEVITIERDHNDFISASVITKEGNSAQFYINPKTGKKVGDLIESAPIFQWTTNLHRSLFLKSTGRVIIGVVSFLLFLIAVTGVILIAKRQGGISKWFSKIVKDESSEQYYHVVFGRYSLVPIIIITLTGVYLSLEKFSLLPKEILSHNFEFPEYSEESRKTYEEFALFQTTSLAEVKKIEFPFSESPEDYFLVNLNDRELIVHQFTGDIISELEHPFTTVASTFSLNLHTGRGSILWSLILLIATSSILYFIYSGFAMTLERRKKSIHIPKNIYSSTEAEYIILVGSETGSTYQPAKLVFDALKSFGKKVFLTDMNSFTEFPKMKELLVFTSTYGIGEAPANAKHFLERLNTLDIQRRVNYSVVGFGSLAYPDFCEFAVDVDAAFQKTNNFQASTQLYKIHNQSFTDFHKWTLDWSDQTGVPLHIDEAQLQTTLPKQHVFRVTEKSNLNEDDTFTLILKSPRKVTFQSGDLLAFYPEAHGIPRYYSIGRSGKNLLLSIKKHEFGKASSLLSQLQLGDSIKASIKKNPHFHFPKRAKDVILIANGTGIAPFLGMIQEIEKGQNVHLFWGGRTATSFNLYKDFIDCALLDGKLKDLHLAYSREEHQKTYVQDVLEAQSELVFHTLKNNGVIMICGSLVMEKGVKNVLEKITYNRLKKSLAAFHEQIQSDCY